MVLDIDEKGNIFTREKTEQELENEYIPKAELIQKMNSLTNNNVIGIMGKAYLQEYNTVGKKFKDNINRIMEKLMDKDESYYQNTINKDEINK